jgi:hypothetical protein
MIHVLFHTCPSMQALRSSSRYPSTNLYIHYFAFVTQPPVNLCICAHIEHIVDLAQSSTAATDSMLKMLLLAGGHLHKFARSLM